MLASLPWASTILPRVRTHLRIFARGNYKASNTSSGLRVFCSLCARTRDGDGVPIGDRL